MSTFSYQFTTESINAPSDEWHPDTFKVQKGDGTTLYVIATELDQSSTEVKAAELAMRTITRSSFDKDGNVSEKSLRDSFDKANKIILNAKQNANASDSIATAVAAIALSADKALVAYIGNPSVYLYRGDDLYRLEQGDSASQNNSLSGSLDLKLRVVSTPLELNDRILISSPGVSCILSEGEVRSTLSSSDDIRRALAELAASVRSRVPNNSLTIQLIDVKLPEEPKKSAESKPVEEEPVEKVAEQEKKTEEVKEEKIEKEVEKPTPQPQAAAIRKNILTDKTTAISACVVAILCLTFYLFQDSSAGKIKEAEPAATLEEPKKVVSVEKTPEKATPKKAPVKKKSAKKKQAKTKPSTTKLSKLAKPFRVEPFRKRFPTLGEAFAVLPPLPASKDELPEYLVELTDRLSTETTESIDIKDKISLINFKLQLLTAKSKRRLKAKQELLEKKLARAGSASEQLQGDFSRELERSRIWKNYRSNVDKGDTLGIAKQVASVDPSLQGIISKYEEASLQYIDAVSNSNKNKKDKAAKEALDAKGQELNALREDLKKALAEPIYNGINETACSLFSVKLLLRRIGQLNQRWVEQLTLLKSYRTNSLKHNLGNVDDLRKERDNLTKKLKAK